MKEKTKKNTKSHVGADVSVRPNNGITLIALVITIVIMLILATVTIGAINGGLFDYAGKAKKETEETSEKSQIEMAYVIAKDLSKTGRVTESNLQKQLDKQLGENVSKVYQMSEGFEIFITNTSRYYELDNKGNLVAKELIKDKKPANFYYDKDGNELDGTTKPYEINCIEDLVVLANLANGAGNYIDANGNVTEITELSTFSGKKFVLTKTLNFESPASYSDLSIKWSYDSEKDAYIIDEDSTTNLKEIITDKNGVGFVPIGINTGSANKMFSGSLDGQGNEIQEIYENRTAPAGLFRTFRNATVKDIGVIGHYITTSGAGGIAYISPGGKFYNCYSKVNIEASGGGGILANSYSGVTIINCCNYANFKCSSNSRVGGIVGSASGGMSVDIINSYNKGAISSGTGTYASVSNILGNAYSTGARNIINSCAFGNILSNKDANIFYYVYGGATVTINNCYYLPAIIENNSNVTVNEGAIEITDLEDTLEALNTYVTAHKNDYAVPLKEWTIKNGELAFKD